jgi:type I restriction enzyme M protein
MLDVETKRRIDTARDILVGKVPDPKSQVEQITIALIYKFMDDMDAEAEELGGKRTFFSGEFARYGWANLMDVSLGGQETLNRYAEGIEKMNQNQKVPQLFRDIFKNAFLPYRDPETLKMFLKTINEFKYDHSERLGDAFEYLLSIMSSQGDAGQFRTPRHIIDFMVELVDPKKEDRVLDPACGTAGFLISAYKHILREESGKQSEGKGMTPDERKRLMENFEGYDISPDMVRLSLVNLYLHGFTTPKIYEYDTLTSEDRWNDYADVILANPPFMSPKGGIRPHRRFSVESNRSEVLFVDYIMEHLTPNGRAAVIVPEGIIFQSGKAYKALRKMLVENDYLVGVISLPAGVFNPYSGVKTSILWIDRALAKKMDSIIFSKVEHDGFDLGAQRRPNGQDDLPDVINELNKFKKTSTESQDSSIDYLVKTFLIQKDQLSKDGDYNLGFERYNIGHKGSENYESIMIKELAEFSTGLWTGKKEPFVQIKVIRNTNFRKDGFIDWTNIAEIQAEERQFDTRELQYGDIILEKSGGGPTLPVGLVAFFDSHDNGYSFSNFTSLIRTTNEQILPKFLWLILWYLHTIGVTEKFQQQTSGIRNLDLKRYQEIKIPILKLEEQVEIVAEIETYHKIIEGAQMVVENYRPRIEVDPSWPVVKLGEVFSRRSENVLPMKLKDTIVNYIGLENIGHGNGKLIGNYQQNPALIKSTKNRYKVGDILYGKLRPNLRKVYLAQIDGICSTDIMVLCSKVANTNNYFYSKYFLSPIFHNEVMKYLRGAQLPRIGFDDFSKVQIPFPPLETQNEISEKIRDEEAIINKFAELIMLYEKKIQDRITKVWGE